MKMETPPPSRKSRAKAAKAQRWHGHLEGIHRGLLYGWVIDVEQPHQRIVLEVLQNGESIATTTADVARSDLLMQFKSCLPAGCTIDACHGFVADMGGLANVANGVVTVRIANTSDTLPGFLKLENEPSPPMAASSIVLSDGALTVYGRAIDARDVQRNVMIRAYLGDQLLTETAANLTLPTTRIFDGGDHCFILDLPLSLGDGRGHTIRVVDELGNPLNGSPLRICCYADGCKTLLPEAELSVLGKAIDSYERILPHSLSMAHYSEWHTQFELQAGQLALPPALAALKVGLLLCGGDSALAEQTLASLDLQTHPHVHIFLMEEHGRGNEQDLPALINAALDANCDILACIRAGDVLAPHAISAILEGFDAPAAQLVYADSERAGRPWFKPAWNAEYALASDYPLDFLCMRARAVRALPAAACTSIATLSWTLLSQQWATAQQAIVHVPRVLLRSDAQLAPHEQQARYEAAAAALAILEPHSRLEQLAAPAGAGFLPRRVVRLLTRTEKQLKVSLIIPTRDRVELLERCISTILQHTQWANLEIIVVDNDSVLPKTHAYFKKIARQGIKVLPCPGRFNFATLNNVAVAAATGDIIGMINNDIEARHDGWMDEIISHLMQPGVGAVGAKLLWPNGMVQHGGILLGIGNSAGHYGNRLADSDWGDHGRNQLLQQVSGVTAACLFLRKQDYLAAGGMDEIAFPVGFNDVDLCLKLRQSGKTIIWTPYATMLHAESASRGAEDTAQKHARMLREMDQLRSRWNAVLLHDPAYHPSLNLDFRYAFGGLALPPRRRTPRRASLHAED